ncbi:hypothetical protein MKX01_009882 [Papaver californicum]|nr:hypothetical protein MKX01_009882 [Papaver californicum]
MNGTIPSSLLPSEASPEWMNKADNAWQLTAATLVGLQSVPRLVILYGSIIKKKWAVNSAFMALYAFAAVLVCCVGWGYRLSLEQSYLLEKGFAGLFPTATMVFFQFIFAAISLILIAGALLGRMNFHAWMLFVPLWLTFSYTIGAFSIWSLNGYLYHRKAGVIDYSGGYVIHLYSGVAGFTAAYWVGPRANKDRESFPPNKIILMLAGAGLLWMGWTGFNSEDPYVASIDASLAVLNTHVWVVQGWAAILKGMMSGSIPWYTMMVLHKKIKLLKHVDDTMAVFHTHAVAGSLGGILTGFFAEPKLNRLFYAIDEWEKYTGLLYGFQMGRVKAGFRQMGLQIGGIVFIIVLNVISTSVICLLIRVIVPLRLSEEDMQLMLCGGDGEKFETSNKQNNSASDVNDFPSKAAPQEAEMGRV